MRCVAWVWLMVLGIAMGIIIDGMGKLYHDGLTLFWINNSRYVDSLAPLSLMM